MILVTGCSGVLGSALLSALRARGDDVLGVRSAELDLTDTQATLAFFKGKSAQVIYHAAARVHGLMGNREFPCDVYTENTRINTNVIEAARLSGCKKIIAISTVAAYPDGLPFPISESAFWNGSPHKSEQAYAHSKRAMLAHLEACKAQYGMDFTYPIVTNLFGPHDKFDEEHGHVIPSLVSKFYRAANTGEPVNVWGTGRAKRDFMFGEDAAAAIILAGERVSGAINIASGQTVPIASVVDYLAKASGVSNVVWDPSKPDGQLDRSYDVSKLAALEFKAKTTLEAAVHATYAWYAENYPNVRS
jgi:GDP-L-fucose synthase